MSLSIRYVFQINCSSYFYKQDIQKFEIANFEINKKQKVTKITLERKKTGLLSTLNIKKSRKFNSSMWKNYLKMLQLYL